MVLKVPFPCRFLRRVGRLGGLVLAVMVLTQLLVVFITFTNHRRTSRLVSTTSNTSIFNLFKRKVLGDVKAKSSKEQGWRKHVERKTGSILKTLHTVSQNWAKLSTIRGDVGVWESEVSTSTKICPPVPPDLVGVVEVNSTAPSLEQQEQGHVELLPGGHFIPFECDPRHKVAVIVPYRNRAEHLTVLLYYIHPILQRQQLDYTIFVVEQSIKRRKFNRGMLMNVGAQEALRQYPFSCFIFHDVDLLPENDRNLYTCTDQPRHLSIAIDKMNYKLPYEEIFGGVSAMSVDQFKTVNGFSNKFWGWGGEDDDMYNRISFHGFLITRYSSAVGRYTMLSHKKEKPNPRRVRFLRDGERRFSSDGLNSVKYRVRDIQLHRLYTWIYVDCLISS